MSKLDTYFDNIYIFSHKKLYKDLNDYELFSQRQIVRKSAATLKLRPLVFFQAFWCTVTYVAVRWKFCPFANLSKYQSKYNGAIKIAKLCCHWLKFPFKSV